MCRNELFSQIPFVLKGLQNCSQSKFSMLHDLQFFVVNHLSQGVPHSMWACNFAGFDLQRLIVCIWIGLVYDFALHSRKLHNLHHTIIHLVLTLLSEGEPPFSLLDLVVTLLRGAPCAVTRCFRKYHLFFTTLSHNEHETPCDWMCTLTICCFKLKELEKVFQQ